MSEAIDNQAQRIQTLKRIVKQVHDRQELEQVKKQLRELVQKTDAAEIVAMEQQLLAEGMPASEICTMSGLHLEILREILVQPPERRELPSGHPAEIFERENAALRRAIADVREVLAGLRGWQAEEDYFALLTRARQAINLLKEVEKHYKRKEKALLPALEGHGITCPSQIMTAQDNEVLLLLSRADGFFREESKAVERPVEMTSAIERALDAMEEMIYREENILLPVALDMLTEKEWAAIWRSMPTFGWCLIQPGREYTPSPAVWLQSNGSRGAIELSAGSVTVEQLDAIFSVLPVDLTFVNADDRVAFFNEGKRRIFSRPKDIIGRKVQFCHPVSSIDLVNNILKEFRGSQRDVAEFWIHLQDKFVHIRFFAVRDEQKNYIGALEFVQDIAPLRALEGDRRLLDEDPAYATNTTR